MRFVLDASAVVAFVIARGGSPVDRFVASDASFHVPAICDVEVVSALLVQVRRGRLSDAQAREALIDYVSMPFTRHLHVHLIGRAFELGDNFTSADASYVALAEALDADLVTLDRPLARATRRHTQVHCMP